MARSSAAKVGENWGVEEANKWIKSMSFCLILGVSLPLIIVSVCGMRIRMSEAQRSDRENV